MERMSHGVRRTQIELKSNQPPNKSTMDLVGKIKAGMGGKETEQ